MKRLIYSKKRWILEMLAFLSSFLILFLTPMILVSPYLPLAVTVPATIPIIWRIPISTIKLIFAPMFIKAISYLFLPIFMVILAVVFLSNEKITEGRFRLSEKRTIWQLFLGYFFLFFLFYYIVSSSIFERVSLKGEDFFIYSTLIGLIISILLIITRYLIKKNVKMGDSLHLGYFFLLIFASAIILQIFMLYIPQFSSIYTFSKWEISTENVKFNAMSNYYYPLIFSFYLSIIDYLILERRKWR